QVNANLSVANVQMPMLSHHAEPGNSLSANFHDGCVIGGTNKHQRYPFALLRVFANLNPSTKSISPLILHRPFRKISVFNSFQPTILTIHNRSYGFDPFVDQWPQRGFMPGPNGPGVLVDAY